MQKVIGALALLAAFLFVGGCAGDSAHEGAIVVAKEMTFSPTSAVLHAGSQQIVVRNDGKLRHTFSINRLGEEVTINPGDTETLTVDFAPGAYRYVCRILDHEGLGMHGVIRVRATA